MQAQSEQEILSQRKRSEELADRAGSLKELIDGLDEQMAGVRDAAEMEKLVEQEIRCRIIKLDTADEDVVVDRRVVVRRRYGVG